MKQAEFKAEVDNLDKVMAFIDEQLEASGCPMKIQTKIEIAVEEIFVNIASYAYTNETGTAVISIQISDDSLARITFTDSGVPYDPLAKPDPNVFLPLNERNVGGLGIFMVKNIIDNVYYEYKDGYNILTLENKLG